MARTRGEHVVGAAHVDVMVFLRRTPGADLAGAVHDRIETFACRKHAVEIGHVADALLDVCLVQRRISVAVERDHAVSGRSELLADRLTEEAAPTRDQDFHAQNCSGLLSLKPAPATFHR